MTNTTQWFGIKFGKSFQKICCYSRYSAHYSQILCYQPKTKYGTQCSYKNCPYLDMVIKKVGKNNYVIKILKNEN